jgi:hypothetical protein
MVIFHSYVTNYQRVVLLDFKFQYVIICHPGPQDPRTQEEQFAHHATQTHSCIANFHRKQLTDVDGENHADEGEDKAITFRNSWFLDVLVVNLSCFQLPQNRRSS